MQNLLKYIQKIDRWLTFEGFLSKTGALLIGLGIALTYISFWLGIHVLMFIPSFVIGIFIYSFIDVYYRNRNIQAFWQMIRNKVNLSIVWNNKQDFSFLKIAYIDENNSIRYLIPDKNLIINSESGNGTYILVIQGRLDIFKKIIKLGKRPTPLPDRNNSINVSGDNHDIYFEIKPYKEGDNLSRIDPIQTIKRNQIYIRHELYDVINKKVKYKALRNISMLIKSDFYIKKRDDLKKGILFEWILIILALIGIQLEWENFIFSLICIFLIFAIYFLNSILKKNLHSRKVMNLWIILLFIIFILETVVTKDMIEAGVHFLLLLCIIKHRFLRERRDAFTYIFLVLFIFVALSFFTLKLWFMLLFLGYLLISIALFSIYAGGERKEEYESNIGRPKSKVSYIVMNILIILLTIALFFILPHGQGIQTSSNRQIRQVAQPQTGFSESVNLNQILSIKKDFSKQFLIEDATENNTPLYESLYWRGMRFSFFENGMWKHFDNPWINYIPTPHPNIKSEEWNVTYFPANHNTMFLPTTPLNIKGNKVSQMAYDGSIVQFQNKILKSTPMTIEIPYDVDKIKRLPSSFHQFVPDVNEETKKLFQPFWDNIPEEILGDPYKISDYIENSAGFRYSLEEPARNLESFLYDEKQGHCEYFATVLALTLQHLNYPVTLVNGFYGGEFNDVSGTWIIRGQNAHTWVEIMNQDKEWIVLDATPNIKSFFWFEQNKLIQNIITYYDTIEYRWFKYVVHFDYQQQYKFWQYFSAKKDILYVIFILLIVITFSLYIYKKNISTYMKLSRNEKFMHWLSKKSKIKYFILESLEYKYPELVKITREKIYGNKENIDLEELKSKWSKVNKGDYTPGKP